MLIYDEEAPTGIKGYILDMITASPLVSLLTVGSVVAFAAAFAMGG